MTRYNLSTPISKKDILNLNVGDIVFISGFLTTSRDQAHLRALEFTRKKKKVPIDYRNSVLFHCGPVVKKTDNDWTVIAAGPTTSNRMEEIEHEFIRIFNIRMIIGKGGMGENTTKSLKENKAVYCSYTGGAGALAAKAIEKVVKVEWLDLGIPEAAWTLKVRNFGPCIVSIDSKGNNLYSKVSAKVKENFERIIESKTG
jgi:fumarate hydratase subunit beta